MSDFLQRLAARLVEPPQRIRPRAASPFEDDAQRSPAIDPFTIDEPRIASPMRPAEVAPERPAMPRDLERSRHEGVVKAIGVGPTAHVDPAAPSRPTVRGSTGPAAPHDPVRRARHEPAAFADEPRHAPVSDVLGFAMPEPIRMRPMPPEADVPDAPQPSVAALVATPRPSSSSEPARDVDTTERRVVHPPAMPHATARSARSPSRHAHPTAAAPAPTVHVTIERVDVRAPAAPAARPTPPSAPRFDLQGYLRERGEARRR